MVFPIELSEKAMTIRGWIENGAVVLPEGVRLPEGQTVTIQVPDPPAPKTHSVLDIPSYSMGAILIPFSDDDDFLGEMLEGRV
jgi:hypothetical protein